jgi:hypothetical protein
MAQDSLKDGTVQCVPATLPTPEVLVVTQQFAAEQATTQATTSSTLASQANTELQNAASVVSQAGTSAESLATQLANVVNQLKTLDATNPANASKIAENQKTIDDLTRASAKAASDLATAQGLLKQTEDKLKAATEKAARDEESAKAEREKLAALTKANGGGALPSVDATSLGCESLATSIPGLVCPKTGLVSLVSINRGTVQVPVKVYKQPTGSWVGYGAAGSALVSPWKGVYVTIKPGVSRGEPNSVACVWDYTPPNAPTTVAYTTGFPSIAGTLTQYPLFPTTTTTQGSAIPDQVSMTILSGDDPIPWWPVETTTLSQVAKVSSSSGLAVGAIVGIAVGGFVLVALIVFILILAKRRADVRGSSPIYYGP